MARTIQISSTAPNVAIKIEPMIPRDPMADPNDKVEGQVSGRYYVDSQCIDCDLCRETAPANFQRNDEAGFSYVYKQPETEEEETLCKDALDNCPVEAIGNDGG